LWDILDERVLYTITEAARLLSLSKSTAYVLVKRGDLQAVQIGRTVRNPRIALEQHAPAFDHLGTALTAVL
jgi:excisionase family DNA binding protein